MPAGLSEMLAYAGQNYACHTDWYLRHRDSGIKTLGVVIAASFTVGSLYFDHQLNSFLAELSLALIALLSLGLMLLATKICSQAYRASLENALLVSKVAWAMGLAQEIGVPDEILSGGHIPAAGDKSLYVPRYLRDARKANTTDAFADYHHSIEPYTLNPLPRNLAAYTVSLSGGRQAIREVPVD